MTVLHLTTYVPRSHVERTKCAELECACAKMDLPLTANILDHLVKLPPSVKQAPVVVYQSTVDHVSLTTNALVTTNVFQALMDQLQHVPAQQAPLEVLIAMLLDALTIPTVAKLTLRKEFAV